ncbi:MAG: D-tyrosyl-tRNA(Tyr) deacylase [Candidatus Aminicenantes bacterium]|nr:D-tyrosyl-tRNA(Tyr) deacylase [Candidatus Aminicenantes bacterium]
MRAVIQRVKRAEVKVEGKSVGKIGKGLLVLASVEKGDGEKELDFLVRKTAELRIFEDEDGKMNLSLLDVGGEILLISQFTLAARVKKGRRPCFDKAEDPQRAKMMLEEAAKRWKNMGINVEQGIFGARMEVSLINYGPVTIILDRQYGGEK